MRHPSPGGLFRKTTWPSTLLLIGLIGVLSACGPAPTVVSLEHSPSGRNKEAFGWTTTALNKGGAHRLQVSLETNPAKLMGWGRNDRSYKALLDLELTGPEGLVSEATVTLPITELKTVRESRDGSTTFMAYEAAGEAQDNGMHAGVPVDLVRFRPAPGQWDLKLTLRAPPNTDRRGLRVIRSVRVDVLTRDREEARLDQWTKLEQPEAEKQPATQPSPAP